MVCSAVVSVYAEKCEVCKVSHAVFLCDVKYVVCNVCRSVCGIPCVVCSMWCAGVWYIHAFYPLSQIPSPVLHTLHPHVHMQLSLIRPSMADPKCEKPGLY